nr:hypothetical protein [Tanacetum cinerariifolium]
MLRRNNLTRDGNPISTLGDYSKPSHEGYRNTIELSVRNNVVPLRSNTIRAPKKVLIREEAKFPVTKNVNSISLTRGEEERSEKTDVTTGNDFEKPTKTETEMPVKEAKKEDEAENKPNRKARKEETTEAPSSQPTDCKTILKKLRTTFENAFISKFKECMQKYTRFNAQSFQDEMIFNMDSIGKYMVEIILHQQRTPQLLKQKKLMQTQENHSNPIPALNDDSLKVDLVAIQNTCSEKEDMHPTNQVNKRQMQTQESKINTGKAVDADLIVTESSETESEVQDDNNMSGNDTDDDDAHIRPIYDEEPMVKIQLTAECNIFATGQQHTEQPEIINKGRVDQYTKQCQVKSPMLDSSPDNQTTDY